VEDQSNQNDRWVAGKMEHASAQEKADIEKVFAGPAPVANPAWEVSGPTAAGGFSAAKKDVLVSVNSLKLTQEQREKILVQALSKI